MVDSITVAVIGSALRAIVGEMGEALKRSSHSPIIREMLDFSCAMFTVDGETVAQDENIPALLGSMAYALPVLIEENPLDTIVDGDIFIGNDPYRGGTHTPDIHIFAPIFVDGRVIGWVGNLAHHTDVGGTNPGTEGFANRSIFEEGLRFPYVRLVEAGRFNQALLRYIENNVRDPQTNLGDLRAQIAAVKLGLRRVAELVERYGAATLESAMQERLIQGERRVRTLLAKWSGARGHAVGYLDNDGVSDEPVRIETSVAIVGDDIVVDFTGTGPQMQGGLNCSRTATLAAVLFAVKAAFDPYGDHSAGCNRPIRTVLPQGTLVNPAFPAAVSLRHLTAQRITDTIIRALTAATPEVTAAGSFVGFSSLAAECRHPRTGQPGVMADDLGGGLGASAGGDGLDAVDTYLGNVGLLPAEICERQYPIRIATTELMTDSAGAGAHRGGLGIRRVYEFLDTCDVVFYTEQTRPEFAAWGADGGHPGAPARLRLIRCDGSEQAITKNRLLVYSGDRLVTETGGGGGRGDPRRRDPEAVQRDLREGKISREAAVRLYGVVTDP